MTDIVTDLVVPESPENKYITQEGTVVLTGTQALVRMVLEVIRRDRMASLRTTAFISGYPGSPLGGLDLELARHQALLKELDIVHLPGHNEELAATAVAGSQLVEGFRGAKFDGVLGVWYGKAPGLDRALDAIRHGQFTGASAKGGVVLFVGDDPECKSSTLPSSSERTLFSVDVPVLYPGTVEEVIELGNHAVAMSRASGLWTALKMATSVADGIATVAMADNCNGQMPAVDNAGFYIPIVRSPSLPDSLEAEREIVTVRTQVALEYAKNVGLNRITLDTRDAWIGIVAAGTMYREVVSALEQLGLNHDKLRRYGVRLMQVQMLYPLEPSVFRTFSQGLSEVIVVEEKHASLERYMREALYGTPNSPIIVGRNNEYGDSLLPGYGIIRSSELADIIAVRLGQRIPVSVLAPREHSRPTLPLLVGQRTPFFCSGCPHNTSTRVPDGALVGGGIGCHAIVRWADKAMVGNVITKAQMGGEGATWLGLAPFVNDDHIFQNMGDGTYFHSGQLAVQAAVAAGSHITFKLLYNSAIAMTGGQSPSESNSRPVADVAEVLLRQGVSRVLITTDDVTRYRGIRLSRGVDVWPRSRVVEAQRELAKVSGVTVLIHDQRCAAEKRRDRKRGKLPNPKKRVYINQRVCEGCGDCGVASNCLSVEPVETELGRKTTINQTSCNMDYSCLKGNCPSFITLSVCSPNFVTRLFGRWQHGEARGQDRRLVEPNLSGVSDPQSVVDPDDFTVRMPGIGGTGVVTANQIIGTAAAYAGRHVQGLDQTGLSQKAGPVVSDLRVSIRPLQGANRASRGTVDLFLGFDALVALSASNIETIATGRTVAVISSSSVPTSGMITHTDEHLPSLEKIEEVLSPLVGADRLFLIDALKITEQLLGSTTCANVFLIGVAFQLGGIPLPSVSVERAIEKNAVTVRENLAAFRWGRIWVADRAQLMAATDKTTGNVLGKQQSEPMLSRNINNIPDLRNMVAWRSNDLIKYQNDSYSTRYLDIVECVLDAEENINMDAHVLSASVVQYLYKLMAYKDEYEVARLHLEDLAKRSGSSRMGLRWHLEPPMLKAVGYDKKIEVGLWFKYIFYVLRAARRVRGTILDPFGLTAIRRVERQLVKEYEQDIRKIVQVLSPANYDVASEFAQLPDIIRGYDDVKLGNIKRYRTKREELLERLFS